MDTNGSSTAPESPAPADLILQQRKEALQGLPQPSGDGGGILSQLSSNPFFTAGFGLAGLGAAATFAQRGLKHGAALIRRRMLVDVEINIKDDSYTWFLHWMTIYQQSQLNGARAAAKNGSEKVGLVETLLRKFTPGMRQLSIQTQKVEHSNGAIHTKFTLIPGTGRHILRYKNAFVLVNRVRESSSRDLQSGRPWETVTLTTLYAHRHIFEDMFAEAHEVAARSHEGKTRIYNSWGAEWQQFGHPRRKRPLESVVLDDGIKERIVEDVKDFLDSGRWYYDRGIPYRRGYLLHGPPGSGKSSFIQALAGELDYDIAILNLSERGLTDDRLNHLLTIIPNRTLVLLEDVDAAFSNRRVQTEEDGYRGANVTFSGLLNALDGVASAEERIIFLTTNHVERLDEALVRPGRVDMTVRLGEATRYQVAALWDRFYGEFDPNGAYKERFLDRLSGLGLIEDGNGQKADHSRTVSTAALQGLFLYNKGDMERVIKSADLLAQPIYN
ncbi:putative mitochondrial chaperone BCS1 [Talaromyces proteolyticus]|uniref:Mitochondrial chaperone BCS1 n=1 Tax=Talaromyces proteolyticus TaxID=1131652 RepID=A0AAD4PUT8_9EURO|nr:putative mitochondrial chaperone BCS1 [Talaromyces proteolyticus]KAH8695486.1 putative mitochondrial chaperone BCS1 [Talaromyces proteolyticus]